MSFTLALLGLVPGLAHLVARPVGLGVGLAVVSSGGAVLAALSHFVPAQMLDRTTAKLGLALFVAALLVSWVDALRRFVIMRRPGLRRRQRSQWQAGLAALRDGRFAEARDAWRRLAATAPEEPRVLRALGQLESRAARPLDARAWLRRASTQETRHAVRRRIASSLQKLATPSR